MISLDEAIQLYRDSGQVPSDADQYECLVRIRTAVRAHESRAVVVSVVNLVACRDWLQSLGYLVQLRRPGVQVGCLFVSGWAS